MLNTTRDIQLIVFPLDNAILIPNLPTINPPIKRGMDALFITVMHCEPTAKPKPPNANIKKAKIRRIATFAMLSSCIPLTKQPANKRITPPISPTKKNKFPRIVMHIMLVKQIMTKNPKTVPADMSVHEVVAFFRKKRITGAPVTKKNKLVGIITEFDILDFMEVHEFGGKLWMPMPFDFIEAVLDAKQEVYEVRKEFTKLKNATIEKVMSADIVTVTPDTHVSEVADTMTEANLTHVPVVEDGKLVGLVTRSDLIKSLL